MKSFRKDAGRRKPFHSQATTSGETQGGASHSTARQQRVERRRAAQAIPQPGNNEWKDAGRRKRPHHPSSPPPPLQVASKRALISSVPENGGKCKGGLRTLGCQKRRACHSERSEESACKFVTDQIRRFFAALRMTGKG